MKLAFLARNVGPKGLMELIAEEALKTAPSMYENYNNEGVLSISRNGPDAALLESDVVFVGLEAFDNSPEKAIIDALSAEGKKIVILEDTYRAAFRFPKGNHEHITVVAAMPGYESELHVHGFGEVRYFGPPAHWRSLYEAAANDEKALVTGIKKPGETLVLIAGGKDGKFNNKMITRAIEARRMIEDSGKFIGKIVLTTGFHPREEISDDELRWRKETLAEMGSGYADKGDLSTADVMAVADLSIFADASTLTIGGAFARRPMAFWSDKEVEENLKALGYNDGQWFVEDICCSMIYVDLVENLATVILMATFGFTECLSENQLRNFQVPPLGWEYVTELMAHIEKSFAPTTA